MKLLFCIFFSCVFISHVKSQLPETYQVQDKDGCTTRLKVYPDSSFFYRYDCHADASLSFGRWVRKKDSLKLIAFNPTTYPVIKKLTTSSIPCDSIWITVVDKDGINMTNKISIGLEVNGRGSYMFTADSTGRQKFVYKRPGGKMVLRTLSKLFSQRLEFITDTTNQFVITLNIKADWINNTHPSWSPNNGLTFLRGRNILFVSRIGVQQLQRKVE